MRILATSNRNLEKAVNDNEFREDLFFRLNVVNIAMPPLRERPKDVLTLAKYFAKKYAESNSVDYRPFSQSAEEALKKHSWRGNVRELENTIHRSVLLAQGEEIDTDAIMLNLGEGEPTDDAENMVGKTVAEVERDLIIGTLEHCLGNRTHAANILGISIRTLRNKLKIYSEEGVAVPMPGEG